MIRLIRNAINQTMTGIQIRMHKVTCNFVSPLWIKLLFCIQRLDYGVIKKQLFVVSPLAASSPRGYLKCLSFLLINNQLCSAAQISTCNLVGDNFAYAHAAKLSADKKNRRMYIDDKVCDFVYAAIATYVLFLCFHVFYERK